MIELFFFFVSRYMATEEPTRITEIKIKKRGTRQQVLNGEALLTSGNLSKNDLVFNEKTQRICSKKEIERGVELSAKMKKMKTPSEVALDAAVELVAPDAATEPAKKQRKPRAKKVAQPAESVITASA